MIVNKNAWIKDEIMNILDQITQLVNQLNIYSYHYYQLDDPLVSDKQYDDMMDRLATLEKETGIVLATSPTHKVQGYVLDSLEKVKHTRPMLSADKTKNINDIKKFIENKRCVLSWKEDGLTIVVRYKNGELEKAITRGKDGIIGEDVTHTMKMCKNLPIKIPYDSPLEVRGEGVISWEDFNKINESLEKPYTHPRNLAAGTVRQLDSSVARQRNIQFKAFELVQDDMGEHIDIEKTFDFLKCLGFDVVEHEIVTKDNFEEVIQKFNPENYYLPVDGLIVRYDNYEYGRSLGTTSHHPLDIIALKWEDDLYETVLRDIEWNTSRTGLINPVAVFDEIYLDGALTTRATLHNISYIENLELGIGDTIQVYRSNKVIPKVHDNLTRSNTFSVPEICPCCEGKAEVRNVNGSKMLYCCNPDCKAKLLTKLVHFVDKHSLDINSLSEATLDKFVLMEWINCYKDIFYLKDKYKDLVRLRGFGKKSADRLLDAIEKARNTTLDHFINALGIPLIGRTTSKQISNYFHGNVNEFYDAWMNGFDFTVIADFGPSMNTAIHAYGRKNKDGILELMNELSFRDENANQEEMILEGKTFVITGSLKEFKNRDELVKTIESYGGKVSGSVSKNTSFLINNDKESGSSKNTKARQLGVEIISENDFIKLCEV